jgi:hypothetical protein
VWNPFLGFDFGRGNWLRRELEHRCFLALEKVSQQHHSPVRKFQGIMMGSRVGLIDLPKDGRPCAPDGFHRLDRACIGSQLPKLPSLQSIGLMITGLAPLTAGPTRRGAKLQQV